MDDALAILPDENRGLRACLLCSLIKTFDQFRSQGCDNCEQFLQLRDDSEQVRACTSNQFVGMVALMNPEASWVAKWQRTTKYKPGMYAISVPGVLPQKVVDVLLESNVNYENIQKIRNKTTATT